MQQRERTQSKMICYCLHKSLSILHYCCILFLTPQPFYYPLCFLAQTRKGCWKSCWPYSAHCRHGIWQTNASIVSRPKTTEEWNIADFNWIVVLANEKESSVIYSLPEEGEREKNPQNRRTIAYAFLTTCRIRKIVVWYWFYNIKWNNSLEFLEP